MQNLVTVIGVGCFVLLFFLVVVLIGLQFFLLFCFYKISKVNKRKMTMKWVDAFKFLSDSIFDEYPADRELVMKMRRTIKLQLFLIGLFFVCIAIGWGTLSTFQES